VDVFIIDPLLIANQIEKDLQRVKCLVLKNSNAFHALIASLIRQSDFCRILVIARDAPVVR